MKSIIKSLVIVIAVAAVASVATWAYFTDSAPVENNTFGTASINFATTSSNSLPMTLANMVPGQWSAQKNLNMYNTAASTIPVKYRMTSSMDSETLAGLYNLINVRVRHTFAGTINPAAWPIVYDGDLSALDINSVNNAISDTLGINITHVYYLEFQLEPTAGNPYQGKSTQFDLNVVATQEDNPGWTE